MRKELVKKEFKNAFQILMLDKHAMETVAKGEQKTHIALFFLFIPVIINFLLASITVRHFSYFYFQTLIGGLVLAVVAIFLASFIAEKGFRGIAPHMNFFRVIGYASFIGWINIVSYLFFMFGIRGLSGLRSTLSFLAGIWMLVIFYKALRCLHSLRESDALIVLIATVIGVLIVQAIFVKMFDFTGGILF